MAHVNSSEPDNGTGVSPFWPKNKVNPPTEWTEWTNTFFMTADLKERCQTRLLLQEPDPTVEEPQPQPEAPRANETTEQEAARILRDDANRKKVDALNAEIRRKGPRLAHNVFYHELENNMRARLLLSLGTEGTRRFKQKNPNLKLHETTFRDFYKLLEDLFKKAKNLTYERFMLFTRVQKQGERLSEFHASLSEQASKCEHTILERDLVKDLFVSRMNNKHLQ